MRFLVDAQLSPFIATWLSQRGCPAQHVFELGAVDASDQAIWDAALTAGAVIVTKDRDFAEWAVARRPAPQIVWIRLGNVTNATLCDRMGIAWDEVLADLFAGQQIVEFG